MFKTLCPMNLNFPRAATPWPTLDHPVGHSIGPIDSLSIGRGAAGKELEQGLLKHRAQERDPSYPGLSVALFISVLDIRIKYPLL